MEQNATLVQIFKSDKEKLEDFMNRNKTKIPYMRDAIRVCVEYADAHGVLK